MGFVQFRKPLKLINQFSSSIKDQQKPVGQEKLILACCQAPGGCLSFKFRYNKPSLKYQQRMRQSEWKEIGEVAVSLLMEIQTTANKSWQLLWMKSGPPFLFSLDVLHSVKDNPAFLSWFLQQSPVLLEFRNCWNGESGHIPGDYFALPRHPQAESTCDQKSQGIFAFQGPLCAQRGKARNKAITGCLSDDLLIKVPKGGEQQSWDVGWSLGQDQCDGQRAPGVPDLSTTSQIKLLLYMGIPLI